MHARKIVDGMLSNCLLSLHATLAESIKVVVCGAVQGGRLSLRLLARSIGSPTAMRHRVKRADRLLGNTSLHLSLLGLYRAVASQWLLGLDHVLIVADRSDATTDQRWHLLRTSAVVEGRSVTLYEEVHAQKNYGNRAANFFQPNVAVDR